MEERPNSADVNENRDEKDDKTSKVQYSQTTASQSNAEVADKTGSFTELNSLSEQISTENTKLSSADISVNVFSIKTKQDSPAKHDTRTDSKRQSVCIGGPHPVKREQPKPLHTLLPSSTEACTLPEATQSFTSVKSQDSLKTATVHTEADGSDYCAAILLACLFCHPLDCMLETFRGCNMCAWSLCSSVCGCEPAALQPFLDVTESCDPCGCLGVRCFTCDCAVCDVCLPITECLDLAMEISQMLYH
ncbi:uncharacterized protein si:dkey-245f22.3 [Kryptolebias marmoratus]|uniref:uncharacterized protein si:dkey-245f22.3 n=1 Tax=Kryptolebias marmoratus TaxID=37003 RepID=UPI000D5302E2|nr:uncharacterized protein si:dkey-245f22.3 [Kryptolebias marmoratus]